MIYYKVQEAERPMSTAVKRKELFWSGGLCITVIKKGKSKDGTRR